MTDALGIRKHISDAVYKWEWDGMQGNQESELEFLIDAIYKSLQGELIEIEGIPV